jgi:hypothetical protein
VGRHSGHTQNIKTNPLARKSGRDKGWDRRGTRGVPHKDFPVVRLGHPLEAIAVLHRMVGLGRADSDSRPGPASSGIEASYPDFLPPPVRVALWHTTAEMVRSCAAALSHDTGLKGLASKDIAKRGQPRLDPVRPPPGALRTNGMEASTPKICHPCAGSAMAHDGRDGGGRARSGLSHGTGLKRLASEEGAKGRADSD